MSTSVVLSEQARHLVGMKPGGESFLSGQRRGPAYSQWPPIFHSQILPVSPGSHVALARAFVSMSLTVETSIRQL